ncbi:MAG: hypothetical protein Kow0089_11210 [Desulfobulbaceae bacterium]
MVSLSDITSFDVIVVLLFLLFLIRGTWIGFMRQLAVFLALIGSYLLAANYTGMMMEHVERFIENPKAVFYLSFGLLFLLGCVFFLLLGKALRLVVEVTMAGWFDRTLGCILGAVKGLFIVSLLYMAVSSSMVSANELLQKSLTSPFLSRGADIIKTVIRDRDLRSLFQPREPAILPEDLPDMPDLRIELPPSFLPGGDDQTPEEER